MNNKLVEDNIKLVYYIVSREYPTYLHDEDIIQSGMVGLCKAAKAWNEQGQFSTYAGKCIRNEIKREFIKRKPHYKNISLETKVGEDSTLADLLVGDDDVGYIDSDSFVEILTRDEQDVLRMHSNGYLTNEIGETFGWSVQKVQKILRQIKCKRRKFYDN